MVELLLLDAVALLAVGELSVTLGHARATTAIAAWLPCRLSPGMRGPAAPDAVMIQRRWPSPTSMAIQAAVTELSRPEKPPRPATLALAARIAAAAEL
jgi:hypothetical protein